ncbi:MAG: glycosyltransferase family 39 protein [Lachnospiraceae bacterium]|nr:glycosyltransferase family 39 protein [Lachnospiraceae bacterium]
MTRKKNYSKQQLIFLILLLLISLITVIGFGTLKSGFHEDEYYSYYSTNYTLGWNMPDGEWVDHSRYFNEFVVLEGQEFQYDWVKTVQSWDVHPPMYYWFLHTVCSFFPGIFSKWLGLSVNICAYLISIVFFYLIARRLISSDKHPYAAILATAVYSLSASTISSVMFTRMYAVLSACILISFYLHVKAWQENKMTHPSFLLPMAAIMYVGYLTQYYFLIYHFFLTASICLFMLFQTKRLKTPFIYGFSVIIPLILACITYPSSLAHMFRGYRGTEATDNFFNLSNTDERLFTFLSLTDKYLFCGILFIVCILILLIVIYRIYRIKKSGKKLLPLINNNAFLIVLFCTTIGYFVAISKTALLLGDSSLRYILPIFGLLLIFVILLICKLDNDNIGQRFCGKLIICLLGFLLLGNIYHIAKRNVLFLYPETAGKVEYASAHTTVPVVYIFDATNSWCVWESSLELFQYPQVYFTSDAVDTAFSDKTIQESKELLVYINTMGTVDTQIQRVLNSNPSFSDYELVQENKFCNLYRFYGSSVSQ